MKFGEILPSGLGGDVVIANSPFTASDGYCCLLITFANDLDPDQTQKCSLPDLYPSISYLFDTTDGVPESCLFKNMQMTKICKHIQYAKRVS